MNALLTALALAAAAQDPAGLKAALDEKLGKPFVKKAPWILDYDKALAESKSSGRLIFAFFTRSYAPCPPCMAVEDGVLVEDGISDFAKRYVLFLHVTSRIEGRRHDNLLEEKGGDAFPCLVFLDAEGRVVGRHEGERTLKAFDETGRLAASVPDLRKQAETDTAAAVELLRAEHRLGVLTAEAARTAAGRLKDLNAEQKRRIDGLLADFEVREIRGALRFGPGLEEATKAAAAKFAEMKKAGRIPEGESEVQTFWILLLDDAERRRDVAGFEEALKALKARFGQAQEAQDYLRKAEERLEALHGK